MSLISKKTHCFNCDKGEMIQQPYDKSKPYSLKVCNICESSVSVKVEGHGLGIVTYNDTKQRWNIGEK